MEAARPRSGTGARTVPARPLRVGAATPSLDRLPLRPAHNAITVYRSHNPTTVAAATPYPSVPTAAAPARQSTRQCDNTADRPPTAIIIAHTYMYYTHGRTHARTHAHARAHYYRYLSAADGYGGDDKVAAAASYGVYLCTIQ